VYIVYKITNKQNNKIYIGKTKENNDDYFGSGLLIKRAIKKYGIENFTKEIIEICLNEEQLNEREMFWINEFNSTNKNIGYNITSGGNGGDTFTNNPNKEKIRENEKQ
jgi:GIY-YIG catalytic domain.